MSLLFTSRFFKLHARPADAPPVEDRPVRRAPEPRPEEMTLDEHRRQARVLHRTFDELHIPGGSLPARLGFLLHRVETLGGGARSARGMLIQFDETERARRLSAQRPQTRDTEEPCTGCGVITSRWEHGTTTSYPLCGTCGARALKEALEAVQYPVTMAQIGQWTVYQRETARRWVGETLARDGKPGEVPPHVLHAFLDAPCTRTVDPDEPTAEVLRG